MGGFGSGGWNRSGRSTVQETPTLALPALRRAGVLDAGAYRVWRWSIGEREIARIGVRGAEDGLRLVYAVGTGEARQHVDDRVRVLWRPCRFGGVRPFFTCPGCGRMILNLHLTNGRFRCRTCARLTYATRRERARDRHLRAANRLRRKLGGEAGCQSLFGQRPKGMRVRTYERIVAEIERREALSMEELAGFVGRMMARSRQVRREFWR
ncbi:MAG: hypothetical protein AB7J28_01735 [Hyphomonadaceae bacterium]